MYHSNLYSLVSRVERKINCDWPSRRGSAFKRPVPDEFYATVRHETAPQILLAPVNVHC